MWKSIGVLLLLPGLGWTAQPAEAVVIARRDASIWPAEERYYLRYLWLSEPDPKMRQQQWLACSGLCNALSRTRKIEPLAVVMADGTVVAPLLLGQKMDWNNAALLRVYLPHYGWDAKLWDGLSDASLEFLFHAVQQGVVKEVPYPAGTYTNGKPYPAGTTKEYSRTNVLAPWLLAPLGAKEPGISKEHGEALTDLVKWQTPPDAKGVYQIAPVVEASNFVWQASVQFDRKVGYWDFLGVKDKKDFDKLVGFDEKASLAYAVPLLEAVSNSGVAVQARRIEVWEKIGGVYIFTKDQVDKRGQGKRNPLAVYGRDELEFDAIEVFATGANKWWKVLLADKAGKRQDSAPDGVGYFHGSVSNDGKIHPITCFACHDRNPGNGGLRPFEPFFRQQYILGGPSALAVKDKVKGLEEAYLTPIDLDGPRRDYERAVFQATGVLPYQWAASLYEVYHRWERPIDRARAAQLYGVSEAELVKALSTYVHAFGKIDNVNNEWMLPNPRRIGIDQFAESYNLGQLMLRGLPTWPPELKTRLGIK